jgi:alkanesulfonate monooxygenase SsuD/methylene tetrahydromethanopterin reductase-like flavin-dependent oxidoreductase (luciferase family)
MIKPWIFEFFPNPERPEAHLAPSHVTEFFNRYLKLWSSAETLGFEGIFFSEHHFGVSLSPSPNLLIANLASRTRSIRLGVMGMVVPFYEPWRVFEEIAMLDHLTGGRLEIGTATGIPQETTTAGLSFEDATARYLEALEILDAALEKPVISHHGRFWNFDNMHLVPRPLQQPSPPKWTTVISNESARRSARRGSKICTGFHPVKRVAEIFDAYRDEALRVGRPMRSDQLALRRMVTIESDHDLAVTKSRSLEKIMKAGLASDPRTRLVDASAGSHTFSIGTEEFIAGDPRSVAEQIEAQCSQAGAGNFLAIFNALEGTEHLVQSYELFAREVIPVLRTSKK